MMKTMILTMVLTFLGIYGPAHAQEIETNGDHLKLPLTCVYYDKERRTADPQYLTITIDQGPAEQFIGTIYYYGKMEKKVDDMVIKGRMEDGRLVIGSSALMFIELRLNEHTGFGIFYNGLGQDVSCSSK
jgi:hypothetical protein